MTPQTNLQRLMELHHSLLGLRPHTYFELAYTRTTGWMAWICSNHRAVDPHRKVFAKGQGSTPEEACGSAIEYYHNGGWRNIFDPTLASYIEQPK